MKILMTLMGLNIGGAETHVVELSLALKKMGHDIVVSSVGGVFQSDLEAAGIRHVALPLHSKLPVSVVKSYFGLKKLIRQEGFDIVHGHARIPSFLCGLLAKRMKFRFVTSAHWVFKVNFLWKRIANWGEKTIAVSDDIKQYLIDNYKTYPDNISVTINGIDTDKFSKEIDWSALKKEFSLADNAYRIVYVSRMDTDRSAVAFLLARVTPELLRLRPDLEVVIVGDGNDFERLRGVVRTVNDSIGKEVIKLTGGRTDINRFIACADLFVGVSRAALEAMSAGVPVIIAGNEGYIGIFDRDKFKISYDTNYCCRGCAESTGELLLRDIGILMKKTKEELAEISSYNRETILNHYSARKMALDYLETYEKLTPYRHYRFGEVIISGYYGFKNVGDDALLQIMIENLKKIRPDTKITVLSNNPRQTRRLYGIKSVNRYRLPAIWREMRHAKLFINGGGSILQDQTSTKSLLYYTYIMKMALKRKLKLVIYANGFGPINERKNERLVKNILTKADYISLREPSSAQLLSEMKLPKEIHVTSDPAFGFQGSDSKWISRLVARYGIESGKKYFALSLRDWNGNDSLLDEKISALCRALHEKYSYTPVFITMQNSKDFEISRRISKIAGVHCPIITDATAREIVGLLSYMDFVIGMRLHFLIFAAAANVPMIGLSYDPKIDSILEYIRMPYLLDVTSFSEKEMIEQCEYVIQNRPALKEELQKQVLLMREKAMIDTKTVAELLQ